jgi:hypothetical protein
VAVSEELQSGSGAEFHRYRKEKGKRNRAKGESTTTKAIKISNSNCCHGKRKLLGIDESRREKALALDDNRC